LCGHATLATAHILWETGRLPAEKAACFQSKSGKLIARRADANAIALDFPSLPATPAAAPAELLKSIDFRPVFIGSSQFDFLVEADSAQTVRKARVDYGALKQLKTRGLIITAASDDQNYDFISRFFAPGCGIDEDPVTGSAHSVLGPYWHKKIGKSSLRAYQASPRGGSMRVEIHGDRTHLIGQAITVLRGQIVV
jgi:PhzF family phenazine biosynthesis protein